MYLWSFCRDVRHFVETAICQKGSHAPTLTQMKCGLKMSIGDYHLRIKLTELKIVVVNKVSFTEVSHADFVIL